MLKKLILMAGVLLTGLISPLSSGERAYAAAAAVDTSMFQTGNLLRTSASHADVMYQPLFAARPEDREKLTKVSQIMSTVWSKGKTAVVKEELDPFESFFDTDMLVELKNGQSVVLYPEGTKRVGMAYGEVYKILENQEIHDLLQSLLVTGESTSISPEKMKIDEKVHVKGSDGASEAEPIYVFLAPTGGEFSSLESVDGLYYPSRGSLLIHQDELRFGRYDFEFTLPAYGKAVDGTMKPIPSGSVTVAVNFSSMTSFQQVTISPVRPVSISLDGSVLTEPSAQPVVHKNMTYLPVRVAAKLVEQDLQWDETTRSVLIRTSSAATVKRADGQISLWIDGKQSAVQPLNIKNTVYIPLRVAAEAFGLQINWNAATRTVEIHTDGERG
ncbi:copper amine oxidase N-terminal domain-containing protein [Paenibacillus medicaginis]|uniref:Copper amine oxidase N-terminal domain-containing protein n=1 Tax=Paenibacillus medicaginis TaxID=1470560 RepID=A0ABV5BYV2_9BACL